MGGRPIGYVEGSRPDRLRFTYDESWAADPDATPLSVSMPLEVRTHAHKAVASFLWGLLPDNDLVIDRWARDFQCSPRNVVALLANVGRDVAGAAQFTTPDERVDEGDPGWLEPLSLADVGERLRDVRIDDTRWHARGDAGRWSLAGAQAKIALWRDPESGDWAEPGGSIPTTHILKPAIDGLDDHDVNEHVCLALARLVGLPAAETSVESFGDERALVIRRYDRYGVGPDLRRIHQEDCCQALSVMPAWKHQSDGGPGLADLLALLRDVAPGVDPTDELERLCLAAAYNWLVLGSDAHAKNYSLLLSGRDVRLAPLYDVASALPHFHTSKVELAQKIGGEHRAAIIERRHWERLAGEAGLDAGELVARIDRVAADLMRELDQAIGGSGLTESEQASARHLFADLPAWVASCRRRLEP
jgi:serine/threonine-protein kinase HipA